MKQIITIGTFCYISSAKHMYCMNIFYYNRKVCIEGCVSHVYFSLTFSAQTTDQRLDGKWQTNVSSISWVQWQKGMLVYCLPFSRIKRATSCILYPLRHYSVCSSISLIQDQGSIYRLDIKPALFFWKIW